MRETETKLVETKMPTGSQPRMAMDRALGVGRDLRRVLRYFKNALDIA